LFVLRVREPNLSRPFKVWGYPWTNLSVLLVSFAFLVASVVGDIKDATFTLILIVLSYPCYFLLVKRGRLRQAPPVQGCLLTAHLATPKILRLMKRFSAASIMKSATSDREILQPKRGRWPSLTRYFPV
jgi:hypothetical protein